MSQDLMDYEQMTQVALRGVVRDAIRRVIREDGLPGAHHFYISFLTRFPDVEIDEGLAKEYPEEITIVIEHQFWNLAANADDFEVTLKFGGVSRYLKVPYAAVTQFHDPSVGFALQFYAPKEMEAASPTPALLPPRARPALTMDSSMPNIATDKTAAPTAGKITLKTVPPAPNETPDKTPDEKTSDDKTPKDADDKVVSLDTFRKK